MSTDSTADPSRETSHLLSELDRAIDRSSVVRDIVGRYEHLRSIENITGPSRLTRVMRSEIRALEQQLRRAGSDRLLQPNKAASTG